MRTKLVALLATTAVLSGCATLTGDTSPGVTGLGAGDVAARGGGATVTVQDLDAEVEVLVAAGTLESEQLTGSEVERRLQLQTVVLNNLFQIELVSAAAEDEFGVEVTDDEVDDLVAEAAEEAGGIEALEVQLASAGQSLDVFRRGQRITTLVSRITDALLAAEPLSDEEVREAYESRADSFEQASVSHILVPTEAEAEAALERIRGGEDFADVASEVSEDPGSAEAGGSLGLAPRGTYVPEFEAAIWDGPAEVGELVGPFETQFGWHVLRVDEYVVTPPEEALDEVRADLEQERSEGVFNAWFQQLLSTTDVAVAGRFGRWDPVALRIVRDDVPVGQQ